MTDRELMQQALEALEDACGGRCNAEHNPCWQREVAAALSERLAQQERRDWQGLTDDEYSRLHDGLYQQGRLFGWVVDQIEAKLKEKNGRVDSFLRRLLDPEDLGHAVSHEVRQKVRELL